MKHRLGALIFALILSLVGSVMPAAAQDASAIDTDALIDQFLAAGDRQRAQINDVVFDSEYLEGKSEKDGFKQEARYLKRVYVKFLDDTAYYHEEYLEYYKDGELQSPEELEKKARERIEKNRKREARNISYPMLTPFRPENRGDYEIDYQGIAPDVEGRTCYHFTVNSMVEDDEHINGEYYFDTDTFHLVRVDFAPAKLVSKMMFKLKQLDMSITYAPTAEGYWLPREFDIVGKGKAAFLFGVNFAGTEYFRNPRVNVGLSDDLFDPGDEENQENSEDD